MRAANETFFNVCLPFSRALIHSSAFTLPHDQWRSYIFCSLFSSSWHQLAKQFQISVYINKSPTKVRLLSAHSLFFPFFLLLFPSNDCDIDEGRVDDSRRESGKEKKLHGMTKKRVCWYSKTAEQKRMENSDAESIVWNGRTQKSQKLALCEELVSEWRLRKEATTERDRKTFPSFI